MIVGDIMFIGNVFCCNVYVVDVEWIVESFSYYVDGFGVVYFLVLLGIGY